MNLDECALWIDGSHRPHPKASQLFDERSEVLLEPDFGPLNSDRGHDAFRDFASWRSTNPTKRLEACLREWIVAEIGTAKYGPEILDSETIQRQLDDEDLDFHQAVYVLDETILATSLAQLVFEGGIDARAKPIVVLAIERQLHPLVLTRIFGEGAPHRVACLHEVRRLVEAADSVSAQDRRAHFEQLRRIAELRESDGAQKRVEARSLGASPWPDGSVLLRRLPSGTPLLLHLFNSAIFSERRCVDAGMHPKFYVLGWSGGSLPTLEALESMKPADDWSFELRLPVAENADAVEARREMLERVLEPTGLVKQPILKNAISQIKWERLDEYLAYNYDPHAAK